MENGQTPLIKLSLTHVWETCARGQYDKLLEMYVHKKSRLTILT